MVSPVDHVAGPVRTARDDELGAIQEIERAAGALFRSIGMDAVADATPISIPALDSYQVDGRAWVVPDPNDVPIGYLVVDVVDDCAHIAQISVQPPWARQGIGRRLLDHADRWAADRGLAGLTLTTFAEVAWNAPYYRRLGFRVLDTDQLAPGLRAVFAAELAAGLLVHGHRVAMRRDVDPARRARRRVVEQWVAGYERAWHTLGTGGLDNLFTADVSYRPSPWRPALKGREAVAGYWEQERHGPAEAFQMASDVVAVEDGRAVVRVGVAYGRGPQWRALWIVEFDSDGRCRAFEEWPFRADQPDGH